MTSAIDNIGPHLLGRKESPPDARDYRLADYFGAAPTKLDVLLATLVASTCHPAIKPWATEVTRFLEGGALTPPPATNDVTWADGDPILDQGQTPHCCGFGAAQWGNTLPIDDHFKNADGELFYYEEKVIDGEPKAEDGSTARSAAQALQNRKRLATYAFAASVDEVRAWLRSHGPVMMATDWDAPMFTPDANGFVRPDGDVKGGHFYVAVGDVASKGAIRYRNSWGAGWGLKGEFLMTYADAATLFARQGEAVAAVELA